MLRPSLIMLLNIYYSFYFSVIPYITFRNITKHSKPTWNLVSSIVWSGTTTPVIFPMCSTVSRAGNNLRTLPWCQPTENSSNATKSFSQPAVGMYTKNTYQRLLFMDVFLHEIPYFLRIFWMKFKPAFPIFRGNVNLSQQVFLNYKAEIIWWIRYRIEVACLYKKVPINHLSNIMK